MKILAEMLSENILARKAEKKLRICKRTTTIIFQWSGKPAKVKGCIELCPPLAHLPPGSFLRLDGRIWDSRAVKSAKNGSLLPEKENRALPWWRSG